MSGDPRARENENADAHLEALQAVADELGYHINAVAFAYGKFGNMPEAIDWLMKLGNDD